MLAGCYTLDLYCDADGCDYNQTGPSQFIAETGEECRAKARARGWLLGKGKELCPRCSGKKRVKLKPEPMLSPGWKSIDLSELDEYRKWQEQKRKKG